MRQAVFDFLHDTNSNDFREKIENHISCMSLDEQYEIISHIAADSVLRCAAHVYLPICTIVHDFLSHDDNFYTSHYTIVKKILPCIIALMYYQRYYDNYEKLVDIFEKVRGREHSREAMELYHYAGLILYQKIFIYDAIRFYERSIAEADGIGEISYKNRLFDCLGTAYADKGMYRDALDYFNLSIAGKEQSGDREGLAITMGNRGRVYMSLGEYEKALQCFSVDLEISQEIGDIRGK